MTSASMVSKVDSLSLNLGMALSLEMDYIGEHGL